MELIENWLKGNRNFITGRILYAKFGNDELLKKLFAKGETVGAKQKLIEALSKLANPLNLAPVLPKTVANVPKNEPPVTEPKTATAKPDTVRDKMPENPDDAVLQAMHVEWKGKYQRMNYLRHALDQYGNGNSPETIAACEPICREILELEQQINALWAKRDYFQAQGHLPEIKEDEFIIPSNALDLSKLIGRLQRYVRRYKKYCVDEPDNALYASLLAKYQNQLNQVDGKKN